eukprot:6352011-Alexandrium_andersonii.AAC.1
MADLMEAAISLLGGLPWHLRARLGAAAASLRATQSTAIASPPSASTSGSTSSAPSGSRAFAQQ